MTHDASLLVERSAQNIHSDDMLGLVVPRTVLAPVVCGDLFPRVVVLMTGGEELHCSRAAARILRVRAKIVVTGAECLVAGKEKGTARGLWLSVA